MLTPAGGGELTDSSEERTGATAEEETETDDVGAAAGVGRRLKRLHSSTHAHTAQATNTL
jgi:hypothetical protein